MLMIDVGQGDSILFQSNGVSMLVDTGGLIGYEKDAWHIRKQSYSLSKDTLIPLLKSLGISKLDYLVITHGDYDHAGESIELINNFKVGKVLVNNTNFNNLEKEILRSSKNHTVVKNGYRYLIGEFSFSVFLIASNNENDNSIVLLSEVNNRKILLMGDASIKAEEELVKNDKIGKVDFIKIGHHGSRTSTGDKLLEQTKPEIALISAGKNNKFKHPHSDVLEKLKSRNIKIFTTIENGAILIRFTKNVTILTYPP